MHESSAGCSVACRVECQAAAKRYRRHFRETARRDSGSVSGKVGLPSHVSVRVLSQPSCHFPGLIERQHSNGGAPIGTLGGESEFLG